MREGSDQPILTSGSEADVLDGYKSISVTAIIALLLGLLSPLAVITPALCVISIASVIFGLVSLASIRRRPTELKGAGLAMAGLVLASLFGAYAATRTWSRNQSMVNTGREFADDWLELVRKGELQQAHQLHRERKDRKHPLADYAPYYGDPALQKDFDRFFKAEPLSKIVQIAGEGQIEHLGHDPVGEEREWTIVPLRYRLLYQRGGRQRTIPFRVTLGRKVNETTGAVDWHVWAVGPIDEQEDL